MGAGAVPSRYSSARGRLLMVSEAVLGTLPRAGPRRVLAPPAVVVTAWVVAVRMVAVRAEAGPAVAAHSVLLTVPFDGCHRRARQWCSCGMPEPMRARADLRRVPMERAEGERACSGRP